MPDNVLGPRVIGGPKVDVEEEVIRASIPGAVIRVKRFDPPDPDPVEFEAIDEELKDHVEVEYKGYLGEAWMSPAQVAVLVDLRKERV